MATHADARIMTREQLVAEVESLRQRLAGREGDSLRRDDDWHDRIIEAVPAGVVTVAPDGTMLHANAAAQQILGMSWKDASSYQVADYASLTIREDGTPCPAEEFPVSRCLQTGQPQGPQTIGVRRPDGRVAWAVYSAVPVPDSTTARLAGAVVTFIDITPRKQYEEKLRKSEEFHRLISEIASDYAYDCRVDPDGTIDLEAITEGFMRVTGYTLEEIQQKGGWPELIHPDDLPAARAQTAEILQGKGSVRELCLVTKSGETRWIRYSTRPIWDAAQSRVVRLLGAVQDITEHKQDEKILQDYTQRLQALSRRLLEVQEQERRHLARELHDEIGQILTGLKLSLETSARLPPAQLQQSLAQAQRLLQDLTLRVRDLSLGLRPTMLDDFGLVPALVWHLERYTGQTAIQVVFEHRGIDKKRFHPEVETAAYRIVQEALTNVARHAGVREACVRLRLDRNTLMLQIADRGKGFDPAVAQSGELSSGLSGMQERAMLLGGRLEVDAHPGAGTCLTAYLPGRDA